MEVNYNSYYYDYCSDSSSESEGGNMMPDTIYNIKYQWGQDNIERNFLPYELPKSYQTDKYTYQLAHWKRQDDIILYFSDDHFYTENEQLTDNLVITVEYIYDISYRIEDDNGVLLIGAATVSNNSTYSVGEITPDFGWTITPTSFIIKTGDKTEEVDEIPKRMYEDYIIIPIFESDIKVRFVDYNNGKLLYETYYVEGETLDERIPNWSSVIGRPVTQVTYYDEMSQIIENMNLEEARTTTISVELVVVDVIVTFQNGDYRQQVQKESGSQLLSSEIPTYPNGGVWYLGDKPINPTTVVLEEDKLFNYIKFTRKTLTFDWSQGKSSYMLLQQNEELVFNYDARKENMFIDHELRYGENYTVNDDFTVWTFPKWWKNTHIDLHYTKSAFTVSLINEPDNITVLESSRTVPSGGNYANAGTWDDTRTIKWRSDRDPIGVYHNYKDAAIEITNIQQDINIYFIVCTPTSTLTYDYTEDSSIWNNDDNKVQKVQTGTTTDPHQIVYQGCKVDVILEDGSIWQTLPWKLNNTSANLQWPEPLHKDTTVFVKYNQMKTKFVFNPLMIWQYVTKGGSYTPLYSSEDEVTYDIPFDSEISKVILYPSPAVEVQQVVSPGRTIDEDPFILYGINEIDLDDYRGRSVHFVTVNRNPKEFQIQYPKVYWNQIEETDYTNRVVIHNTDGYRLTKRDEWPADGDEEFVDINMKNGKPMAYKLDGSIVPISARLLWTAGSLWYEDNFPDNFNPRDYLDITMELYDNYKQTFPLSTDIDYANDYHLRAMPIWEEFWMSANMDAIRLNGSHNRYISKPNDGMQWTTYKASGKERCVLQDVSDAFLFDDGLNFNAVTLTKKSTCRMHLSLRYRANVKVHLTDTNMYVRGPDAYAIPNFRVNIKIWDTDMTGDFSSHIGFNKPRMLEKPAITLTTDDSYKQVTVTGNPLVSINDFTSDGTQLTTTLAVQSEWLKSYQVFLKAITDDDFLVEQTVNIDSDNTNWKWYSTTDINIVENVDFVTGDWKQINDWIEGVMGNTVELSNTNPYVQWDVEYDFLTNLRYKIDPICDQDNDDLTIILSDGRLKKKLTCSLRFTVPTSVTENITVNGLNIKPILNLTNDEIYVNSAEGPLQDRFPLIPGKLSQRPIARLEVSTVDTDPTEFYVPLWIDVPKNTSITVRVFLDGTCNGIYIRKGAEAYNSMSRVHNESGNQLFEYTIPIDYSELSTGKNQIKCGIYADSPSNTTFTFADFDTETYPNMQTAYFNYESVNLIHNGYVSHNDLRFFEGAILINDNDYVEFDNNLTLLDGDFTWFIYQGRCVIKHDGVDFASIDFVGGPGTAKMAQIKDLANIPNNTCGVYKQGYAGTSSVCGLLINILN